MDKIVNRKIFTTFTKFKDKDYVKKYYFVL